MIPYPTTPLRHGGVELRPWTEADVSLVEEAASDPLLLPGTTLPRSNTPAEGLAFIERQWDRQRSGEGLSLCIARDAEPVGCATLMVRKARVADLGYWLIERARGSGVGTAAVTLLVEWALNLQQLDTVEAFVADDNVPSRRLLERLGFHETGTRRHEVNGRVADLGAYRRDAHGLGRHS